MTASPDPREILVLAIADPGLLSALIGLLSLQKESLITLSKPEYLPAVARTLPRPAILIVAQDGPRPLFAPHSWDLILALLAGTAPPDDDGAVVRLERGEALIRIPEVLADWRRRQG